MMVTVLGIIGALAALTAPEKPSVAVFSLEAKTGISKETAELLTDNFVDEVRRADVFSRVVSAREIETVIGFEQQKQLLNCTASSCIADVAGALGVDFVLAGNLGKLGPYALLNAKLLNTRSGLAAASLSARVCADSDGALLESIQPSVAQLLRDAGLTPKGLVATPPARSCGGAPSPTPAATESASWRTPVRVAGGAGAAAGIVVTLVGLVGLVAAGGGLVLVRVPAVLNNLETPGLAHTSRLVALYGLPALLGIIGLVLGGMGVGILGGSGAAVAASLGGG